MPNSKLSQLLFISFLIILSFSLGWLGSNLTGFVVFQQQSLNDSLINLDQYSIKPAPSNWVAEDKIKVYADKIVINVKDAEWSRFTNTHSMEPFLGQNSNAIQIIPASESQINVGDIISYKLDNEIIIHRVIEKSLDENGIYFIAKGDNNQNQDPYKVRFSQIQRVLVGVIY